MNRSKGCLALAPPQHSRRPPHKWISSKCSLTQLPLVVILHHLPELHGPVQAGAVLAGEGVLGVVAGEGGLVEHGALAAHEAVLVHPVQLAVVVVHGVADVEHLPKVGVMMCVK